MHRCAAAASSTVAPLVTGPRRAIRLVASTPAAAYLTTGDPDLPVLCLAGPDAVRLPCALVLAAVPPLSGPAFVGGGTVSVGAFTAQVRRWWRPPRPRGLARIPARAVAGLLLDRVPDPLDRAGRAAVHRLAAGAGFDEPVRRLLGRGPGLTPVGDDVLAGMLVTLHGLGAPAAARLAAAVVPAAVHRTTAVSAALLWHAARGECIAELADLLTAARDGAPLDGPLDALLRVGHTSGAGLAHGVAAALAAVAVPAAPAAVPAAAVGP